MKFYDSKSNKGSLPIKKPQSAVKQISEFVAQTKKASRWGSFMLYI